MPGEDIYSWSTTAATNSNADSAIPWPEGMPRAQVNNSARSQMAALAKFRDLLNGSIVTGGTANAQTFTSVVGYTAVPTGMRVMLKIGPLLTNTGPATLTMDSIAPVAIKTPFGDELAGGELRAGSYAEFLYDGTVWILLRGAPQGVGAAPMGRLTLAAGTPVMVSSVPSSATIYYCPFVGNQLPVYSGNSFQMMVFEELSAINTDTVHSPAAIGSGVNDWFVWSDAGVLRLSHGPDWSSDTTRALALIKVDGVWLNAADITNACAAQRGTYVGTTKASGGNFVWQIGGVDTLPQLLVWNAYNRVPTTARSKSSIGSFGYSTGVWATFGGLAMSAVFGLNEEPVAVNMPWRIFGTAGYLIVRLSLDNASTLAAVAGSTEGAFVGLPSATTGLSVLNDFLGTGFHTLYAMIMGDNVNVMTIYLGDNTVMLASLRM